jgi:signal transduction histidine kinase
MVAREAVYNSMLHGHPAQCCVALRYKSSELVLDLDDDGCGFDPSRRTAGTATTSGSKA